MTLSVWGWIIIVSCLWLVIGVYFLFGRNRGKVVLIPGVLNPKEDSEVIVSNTKIMINVLFAENEKEQATPAVLADFVISFKDIVKGSFRPGEESSPGQEPGLPDDETPDLTNEPDLPELDLNEVPERGPDESTVYEESQLVDSNTLNLNMSNP
jgi:hypothetical protein